MRDVVKERAVTIRKKLLAGVRIEEREVDGRLIQVKVYPSTRGSGAPEVEGGNWASLRKKGKKAKQS